jgi:dehydrogenase/reductase SDR family protein 7B
VQLTVWITGASSGIGEALALEYAKLNANLILSARNEETLQPVADRCQNQNNTVLILPLDLSESKDFASKLQIIKQNFDKVDILINNGGISQRSLIIETPLEIDRKLFEVNYFGTIALTKLVLTWMIETGGGKMVVISSISGKFGFPFRASYAATKHALIGFFETLGLEHISDNIQTTVVCPGRIRTNISLRALNNKGETTNEMDPGIKDGMPAKECALKIIKAIRKNKREVWIGRKELLLVYFHQYIPRLFWAIAPKIDPK